MDNSVLSNKSRKMIIVILVGILVVTSALLISIMWEFNLVQNLVMSWLLTTAYALFAFFFVEPTINVNPIRYVEKPIVKEVIRVVEKPVFREIQVPMENRVIQVVEKPVIQEVIKEIPVEVEKRVVRYIQRKPRHKTLNIPKFKFIASTQTRTYHKRSCKFARMLKNKYKLHSNTKAVFKKKHFKACKTCLKK